MKHSDLLMSTAARLAFESLHLSRVPGVASTHSFWVQA